MPIFFVARSAFQFVRITRNPLFRASPRVFQRLALQKLARDFAIGFITPSATAIALGIIIDPFNQALVPASGDRLITTNQAVAQVLSLDIQDPGKVAAAVVLAPPSFALDLGIQITQKVFAGVRAGTEMIIGTVRREFTGVSEFPEIFGF